jgi:C_GCAxxG_C_C family probable redox protein
MPTAREQFNNGYNCAQAVLLSQIEKTGLDPRHCLLIAAGFGAGMGRLQVTCGAVTGAVMAISAVLGQGDDPFDVRKARINNAVQAFAAEFSERFGALDCRGLLGVDLNTPEGLEHHKANRYQCEEFVDTAQQILDRILQG